MFLLKIFLAMWLLMQLTFLCYLAIENAIRVRHQIPWQAWVFLGPVVIFGLLCDFLLNITVGTILFMDLPREWLFTARLKRYRAEVAEGKRKKLACFFCEKLLNPFDPKGDHC